MFLATWRSPRGKMSSSSSAQARSTATNRNVLFLERLESRDLLSAFSPSFILASQSGSAAPFSTSAPTGYSPGKISQAYGFTQISFNNGTIKGDGSGQTIAIVDAYSQPNIGGDLQAFDAAFGLPAPPHFVVVNENGGGNLPAANASWGMEESLDVEWAHAMAPGANILLVEANSGNEADLFSAVQYAASQPGVSVVSLSWGGGEFWSESYYDSVFTTPAGHEGVAFIASAGDGGAPPSYPAVSSNVLAVGGTSLYLNSSGGYSGESAWSGSGGGVSAYETQPSYQRGFVSQSSTQRTSPDVAYVADPNTGMSVYDSYGTSAGSPWLQVGGTSAGAPQWAALVAIADEGRALRGLSTLNGGSQLLPMLYQLPNSDFHDVTTGASTGNPNYSAGPGYDLVTGLGSPYADRIVAALSGQALNSGSASPPAGSSPVPISPPAGSGSSSPTPSPPSSPPSAPDPFVEVAIDALTIVRGWETSNHQQMLLAWNDFVDIVLANYYEARSLEQALIADVFADLA